MNIEPAPKYFSIWRGAFRLLASHRGLLLCATLCLAAPFFILTGLASARHIMTLGGAAMMGTDIPDTQMRMLWGGVVGADSLASIALCTAVLLAMRFAALGSGESYLQYALRELPQLLRRAGFWAFAFAQLVIFAMINSPDGRFKLLGMTLLGASVLLLLYGLDRGGPAQVRRALPWSGWLALALVLLTIPLLHIFFNGYVNAILLMLADFSVQKIVQMFSLDLQSPLLPYGVIVFAKFFSQWFNLVPMALLLSTCLALRGNVPQSAQA